MHGPERILLLIALGLPLIVATIGWPTFVRWASGSPPTPQPEVTDTAATSAANARAASTPRPAAPGLPPTMTARAVDGPDHAAPPPSGPQATAATPAAPPQPQPATPPAPAAQPTPPVGPTTAHGDPTAAVSSFYQLVVQHQFDRAAQLWSPRMRAAFPPGENIAQRFGQTQQVAVRRADVVSTDGEQATVAVDLVEVNAANSRHYVGTWSLVRAGSGWLLDQPNLQAAP